MGYDVLIKNNQTGEIRKYHDPYEWGGDFIWVEGNFACDCNRGMFFAEVGGEDDPEVGCGDSLYTCIEAILSDGTRIPLDDQEPVSDTTHTPTESPQE